ncbi:acyl-CoA dehydrogenase family protein [Gordonia sp. DT218]|uniref:acyl-CoA dehydrogenase family protein n=1 Tax=unclassified Gordonia (in: high G+C Gram-positive bacteria) TaxID=2657482 RepID=UPI002270F194|nr:acyl-CoA dehydrogenase family protein [Gordonia sp. SL306]WAC56569.1 acyl-CoA dehydrogenase family protein [Gordonia sp. SL306]
MTTNEPNLFDLPDRYRELQEQARELAVSVRDIAARADESSSTDPDVRARLAASKLTELAVPKRWGGRFDAVDSLAMTVVREQLAAESGHLDSMFAMQGIGSYGLAVAGADTVRDKWLPRVASLDAIAALGLTEPHVGSDLKALTTTAVVDGDEIVVNGHKSFITNGGDAAFYSVLAKEGDGFSLVLVPADTPGVTTERPHQIIAPHVLSDVILTDVRVPLDHRIGEPGKGFSLVLATLATFRVSVAGAAVGMAEAALRLALDHANNRHQFGGPLSRLGSVPEHLASCWTDIEAARSLTYRAAAASARDPRANLHLSSMAKVAATETCGRVVDRSVQIMGRFGITRGTDIERLYREARPTRIYEGSTEVIFDSLAKQLIKRGL